MAKKNYAALLLAAALLTGMTMTQANAVDMGVKLNLPNVPAPSYQTNNYGAYQTPAEPSYQAPQSDYTYTQAKPRSLAENKTSTELYSTVKTIGNKILRANNIQTAVNFKLVDAEEANAATTMDNTVYVYTGLLQQCQNEDELAFVIGHEIGHAVKSHVIKGVVIDTTISTGATVGNKIATQKIAGSSFGGKLRGLGLDGLATSAATSAINMTANAASAKISRGQENDADFLGLDFIVKAGYDPMAAITIMERIGDTYNDFFADHPSTEKRVATMTKYIQEKYPQYAKASTSYSY